jgi:hypothetical protein
MTVKTTDTIKVLVKKADAAKCRGCAYYNGECTEGTPASTGMFLTHYQTRIIPENNYPECQEEVSRKGSKL